MQIAIVDDEKSLLKLTSHTLNDYGADRGYELHIREFTSGLEFLDAYNPGDFDLIFMDVFMPEMDGIETVMKLRNTDQNVTVVFLTASDSHLRNAFSCHAFDYIIKPASRQELFRVMDDYIKTVDKSADILEKTITFTADRVDITLNQTQLVSVSVNGHNLFICDSDKRVFKLRASFSSIANLVTDWDNILLLNRGVLVNMNCIDYFDGNEVHMKDGWTFYANTKTYKKFEQQWQDYIHR